MIIINQDKQTHFKHDRDFNFNFPQKSFKYLIIMILKYTFIRMQHTKNEEKMSYIKNIYFMHFIISFKIRIRL